MIHTFTIEQPAEGERLDRFLTNSISNLSRSEIQRLIKAGQVTVNDHLSKPAYKLESGDTVFIEVPSAVQTEVQPEDIPLDILYQDDDLVAIHKSAGMVVHPAAGNRNGTLVNAALYHWPSIRAVGEVERAGVVHRLDKNTSGVILMAKTPFALAALQAQFKARTVYKKYIALVEGIPHSSEGLIDAPIARDPKRRKRMAVVRTGRPAQTRYRLLEEFGEQSLLELEPLTGRTHQIRVHLNWLGYPIVSDNVYGHRKPSVRMKRMFLHAADLHIDSPSTGERLQFLAPLPVGLEDVLAKLRRGFVA